MKSVEFCLAEPRFEFNLAMQVKESKILWPICPHPVVIATTTILKLQFDKIMILLK